MSTPKTTKRRATRALVPRSAGKAGGSKGKAPPPPPRASCPVADEAAENAILDAEDKARREAERIEADRIKYPPETLASRAFRAADCKEKAAENRARAIDDLEKDSGFFAERNAAWAHSVADRNERDAEKLDTLPVALACGIGGEVATMQPQNNPDHYFLNTLEMPTVTSAAASRARLEQASGHGTGGTGTDSLVQALDAAETLGVSNSLEKMAAHQLAICHGAFMDLMRDGAEMIRKRGKGQIRNGSEFDAMEFYNAEGCRLLSTAARLMSAYQNGLATLARVRQGGRQVVTVQHVQVNNGGQAVVAGSVGATTGGGGGVLPGEGC